MNLAPQLTFLILLLFTLNIPLITATARIQIKNQMLASDFDSTYNENSFLSSTNLGKVLSSLMKNSEVQIGLSQFFSTLQTIQQEINNSKNKIAKSQEFGQQVHDSVIEILQKNKQASEKSIQDFEDNKQFDSQIKDKSDELTSLAIKIEKYNSQIDQLSYQYSEKKSELIVDIDKYQSVLADIDFLLQILVGLDEEKGQNQQFLYMQMNALKLKRSRFNLTSKLPEINPPQSTDLIINCFEALNPNSGYVQADALNKFKLELLKMRENISNTNKQKKNQLEVLEDSHEKNISRLKAEIDVSKLSKNERQLQNNQFFQNPHILKQIDQLKIDISDLTSIINEEEERWEIIDKQFAPMASSINLNQETLKLCFSILNQQGIKTEQDAKIFE